MPPGENDANWALGDNPSSNGTQPQKPAPDEQQRSESQPQRERKEPDDKGMI